MQTRSHGFGAVSGMSRPRRWRRRVVLAAVFLALHSVLAWPAGAAEAPVTRCEGLAAAVQSDVPDDVGAACAGAADAMAFMAAVGLGVPEPVLVELVNAMPTELRGDAVGCYAVGTRRTMVLAYARFAERGTWFGVPVSRALYRSVVAHEVAHAVVGCHLGERRLPIAANEYLAYVTMFATMDPALRAQALAASPGPGFDRESQINALTYSVDPQRFGAAAYRHWRRQPDGLGYLRRVADGLAIPEVLFDY